MAKIYDNEKYGNFAVNYTTEDQYNEIQNCLLDNGYHWGTSSIAFYELGGVDFYENFQFLSVFNKSLFNDYSSKNNYNKKKTEDTIGKVYTYYDFIDKILPVISGKKGSKKENKTKIITKTKKMKTKVKTIGAIRIYRKDKLYLYIKIPKELEQYLSEHLPTRESRNWLLKKGKKEQRAEFYCYTNDTRKSKDNNGIDIIEPKDENYSPFVKIDSKNNKVITKKDSENTERNLEYTFKNNPAITQNYLCNNFGANTLYIPNDTAYNIAPLRVKGASKGITLICDGLLPPEIATEYVSILGQVIKGFYSMLIAKTDIRAKIVLDIQL